MSTETRDFHFNVNVRLNSGSKASMANNEDSFLRAMEIQERKREKKELEKLEEEKITAAQAPVESAEPVTSPEETPAVQEEAPGSANAHAEPCSSFMPCILDAWEGAICSGLQVEVPTSLQPSPAWWQLKGNQKGRGCN